MALYIFSGNPRKVIVPREDVAAFNAQWPCSELRSTRHYWFEFDANGDLIDTDVPEHDDGRAALAMADDARDFLFNGFQPDWIV
jgi:hypothetical protein